jgi:hypothetical protein
MYLQKVISRFFFKLVFFGVLKVNDKNRRIIGMDPRIRINTKNVMDPQHWFILLFSNGRGGKNVVLSLLAEGLV